MPIVGRGSGFEEVPHYVYVPFRATLYYRTLEMQACYICYINLVELLQLLSRSCLGGGGGGVLSVFCMMLSKCCALDTYGHVHTSVDTCLILLKVLEVQSTLPYAVGKRRSYRLREASNTRVHLRAWGCRQSRCGPIIYMSLCSP